MDFSSSNMNETFMVRIHDSDVRQVLELTQESLDWGEKEFRSCAHSPSRNT